MLSARELNSASLPSRAWINERLTFTHGYGLTPGPSTRSREKGYPCSSSRTLAAHLVGGPEVTQRRSITENCFQRSCVRKDGHAGIRLSEGNETSSAGTKATAARDRRAAAAADVRHPFRIPRRTVLSEPFGREPRDDYRRVSERSGAFAPFLTYDNDPYLAISDGRLVWIQDAYTTSRRYPYSTPTASGLNYIRNSVKVTIDAYHGTTAFHLVDTNDPIAATLARVFPALLKPLSDMREDLRTRLRYPQGIFSLQAAMFATFHMTNPSTFYNREDQWDVASLEQGDASRSMEPYYTIMKLPGESGGVHPDAPVHAAAKGQPRGLDGRAQRRRQLWADHGVQFPNRQ